MRSRAPWPQMVVATVMVMVLPAVIVGGLSALGVVSSLWAGLLVAVALSLALSSAGSAYWRRHTSGDVLFSDLLVWGWLRRRRTERRLGRSDELLLEAGHADSARKDELLQELGAALDAQDPYLDGHSRRVARYVTMIAQRMQLPDEQVERAKSAATIHDVGKLRVPPDVVYKPGRLTDPEFALMKEHAAAGGAMVECLGDPELAAAVRAHHERWDGSGYPDGLASDRIPVEARIISVADTFDAITSARPYRAGRPHAKALEVIDEEAGQQLDPEAARAFISCYSDRRGGALWAALASIPRQVAGRLSTSPGELTGVLGAALTAPLVVVAAAAGAAVMPARSDPPPAQEQAVVSAAPTASPEPKPTRPAPAPTPSPAVTPAPSTPAPAPTAARTPTSTPTATPAEPTPARTPPDVLPSRPPATAAEQSALLPDVLAAPFPTADPTPAPPPTPTPTPAASAEPAPTASAEPEPPVEPAPTPEPLPPLFATQLPVFPTPTAAPTPTPTPPSHTRDDCKNGGWIDLGYPNQGQCIADADKSKPDRPHP